jgi:hypothetical protein
MNFITSIFITTKISIFFFIDIISMIMVVIYFFNIAFIFHIHDDLLTYDLLIIQN